MQVIYTGVNDFATITKTDEYIKSETNEHPTVTSTPKEALLWKLGRALSEKIITQEELQHLMK